MPPSVDTNIFVYALNRNSDVHEPARAFLESLISRTDVVIAEQALLELYLLIRNPAVFPNPYPVDEAVLVCLDFGGNPNWRIVDKLGVGSAMSPQLYGENHLSQPYRSRPSSRAVHRFDQVPGVPQFCIHHHQYS